MNEQKPLLIDISFWTKKNGVDYNFANIEKANFIPYKKGDKFWLVVREYLPRRINELKQEGWNQNFIDDMISHQLEKIKDFDNTNWIIKKVENTIKKDPNFGYDKIEVEYYCVEDKQIIKHLIWRIQRKYEAFIKKLNKLFYVK